MSGSLDEEIDEVLAKHLKGVDGVEHVYKRELRVTDPSNSMMIQTFDWTPMDWAMGQPALPCRSVYTTNIQTLVKHTDEQAARYKSKGLTKALRLMLHTDGNLLTELLSLTDDSFGITERISKVRVLNQRYFSDEEQGVFGYVSNTVVEISTTN